MHKDMKRARRRADRGRVVRRAARVYPHAPCPQKLADNLQVCSCHACGNPRKCWGEVTVQEARIVEKDYGI